MAASFASERDEYLPAPGNVDVSERRYDEGVFAAPLQFRTQKQLDRYVKEWAPFARTVRLERKQDSVVGITFQGGTEVNPFTMIYLFREAKNKAGRSILSFHSLISSQADAGSLTFTTEEEHVAIKSNKLLVARVLIRKLVIPVDREPLKEGNKDP